MSHHRDWQDDTRAEAACVEWRRIGYGRRCWLRVLYIRSEEPGAGYLLLLIGAYRTDYTERHEPAQDGATTGRRRAFRQLRNSSGRPSVGGLTIKVSVPAKDQTETSTASKTHTASEADGLVAPSRLFRWWCEQDHDKEAARNSVASSGHGSDDEAPKSPVIRPSRSRPRSRSLRGGVGFSTSRGPQPRRQDRQREMRRASIGEAAISHGRTSSSRVAATNHLIGPAAF